MCFTEKNEILFDKYTLQEEIGKGNSGTVYLAEHIKLKVLRAIKCISKNHFMYEQFLMEARLLKNLKHPGIPIIYDLEEDENFLYIIEEYIKGESLQAFVLNQKKFSQKQIIQIGIQICSILEYLHNMKPSPIIYLDLKPMHIIMQETQIKLIDFGTAIMVKDVDSVEYSMGTPGFAAPEQYDKFLASQKTDIYAIGAVLRFMAENSFIDSNANLKEQVNIYEAKIKKVVETCMESNPNKRYQKVTDLKKQLQDIMKSTDSTGSKTSSLVFAVIGSQPRIGVTHMAIMLVSFLNRKKCHCVYKEKNNSGMLQKFMDNHDFVKEREGVYLYQDFAGIPGYGQGVVCTGEDYSIIVDDYGSYNTEIIDALGYADVIIAVLGTKAWEMSQSEELINFLSDKGNVYFILNFSVYKDLARLKNNLKYKNVYRIPYLPDPFKKDRIADQLFAEVLKNYFVIKKGGAINKNLKTHGQRKSTKNHRYYRLRPWSWGHSFINYVRKLPWF